MAAVMCNLTTVGGVRDYLKKTGFSSCGEIAELSGGTANYAYRVALTEPYAGKYSLVIKHGRPYVKALASLPLDLSRQTFEVEALKRVKQIVPDDALVTVPEVYFFDEKEHVIIMEDCGEHSVPLKQFMRKGRLSPSVAATLGKGLGEFIARLHVWGRDKAVWEQFDKNEQVKQLSAWLTYGRLHETLDRTQIVGIPVLQDPPFDVSPQDLEVVKRVGEEMSNAVKNAHETFVMGDFWPGNMMITPNETEGLKRVYVIDWEACRPGLPGVEIGQFCAEIGFVRHFHPEYTPAANAVLKAFFVAYEKLAKLDSDALKMAVVHAGTHWVVWGSRLDWGGKQETREVVRKGLRLILEGDISEFRLE